MKLAALSVDIDEIDNYAAIFGLGAALDVNPHAIYDKALPRLAQLFADEDVPCTFFAIGRDLTRPQNAEQLRTLRDAGHEIANHSLNHLYDLTRRDRDTQRREVSGGADVIEDAVGVRPVGFRAPGYTITDQLFEVLAGEGVLYDSSVFPCPPYYLAKAAAISWIKLRGRSSHSVVDDPRVLMAPADPYRIGRPYYRRGAGLVELPVAVTASWSGRLPYFGTAVALAGERGARSLTRLAAARSFVNLEMHGIDLADADQDGLQGLRPYQQDLRRSADQKRASIVAAIRELKRQGYGFVTCAEAARRFS